MSTLLQLVSYMSNSVGDILHFQRMPLETPENVLELIASSCWVIRVGGVMKTERAFPFEKKWGSPITQDTTCLVTALSHYGLLMWLSLGKLPSLPPPWWISPWLPNMIMVKGPSSLIFRGWKQTSMIWSGCFRYNFTAIQYDYTCWKHLCICRNICHTMTISNLLMDQCKVG